MADLISIREAARRLGVSDTAVHKAIKAGRVEVASKTESGRPLMDWEDTKRRWLANSDISKRSHVGSRGSKARAKDKPEVSLPTSDRMDEAAGDLPGDAPGGEGPRSGRGPQYAQARALREAYQAKLAKLDYEQKTGKLVDAEEQKRVGYDLGAGLISDLYNLPERLADELAGMADPNAIHALLTSEIDHMVSQIRSKLGAP